jgi:hypothetical protein
MSPPRSAWATPAGMWPSPASSAPCVPSSRSTGLAQDPVTRVLEAEGERVHPASRQLASESAHIEAESVEHDLHCFQAWRRMDESLVANYMVVDDLLDQEHYDRHRPRHLRPGPPIDPVDAFPLAKRALPELRMIVVGGPRIDPAGLSTGHQEGLELRGFVPDLYRHLAACDLAVVQGGLTTAMQRTANVQSFLYFPLAHHFEQNFRVPRRLGRYRAGRRMNYTTTDPDAIAAAITAEIGREVDCRPVERDGAHRAAAREPPLGARFESACW